MTRRSSRSNRNNAPRPLAHARGSESASEPRPSGSGWPVSKEHLPFARVLERGNLDSYLGSSDPSRWTAVVPAAGRGTRLGSGAPKILFPIAGKSVLEHLFALLDPFCSRFVFVLSPSGAEAVRPHLERLCTGRFSIAIQEHADGMAGAVRRGASMLETGNVLVIWGDQVAVRPETIERCIRLHDGPLSPAATVPTLMRQEPYIHLERSHDGRVTRVLQRREGDAMPDCGENDSGVFLFRTEALLRSLPMLFAGPDCEGRHTGEYNFLPILPIVDSATGRLLSARIVSEEECVGVNTPQEAELLAGFLASRRQTAI